MSKLNNQIDNKLINLPKELLIYILSFNNIIVVYRDNQYIFIDKFLNSNFNKYNNIKIILDTTIQKPSYNDCYPNRINLINNNIIKVAYLIFIKNNNSKIYFTITKKIKNQFQILKLNCSEENTYIFNNSNKWTKVK